MTPRLKKIVHITFVTATLVVVLLTLLACLAPLLNAGKYPFIALSGLVFPILFFWVLGLLIYWLIKKSKWAFICIAALLLSWQQVGVVFSFGSTKKFDVHKTQGSIRVLTWNLSSWGETSRGNSSNNMDAMTDLIKTTNADVLCFEEYLYYKDSKYRYTIIPALKEMGYRDVYFASKDYTGNFFPSLILTGTEIMSKYPITATGKFIYNQEDVTEPLIYADININNQPIRFFTTHLESVRFEADDYAALHNLKNPAEINIGESRAAGGKLKIAYKKRTVQAEILHQKIEESPYPVILCGDFNDVPGSYAYCTARGSLQDAFLKKGFGFGRTFRFISPTLRIDYILADKKFDVLQYTTFKVPYSDHYPVVADFDISQKK